MVPTQVRTHKLFRANLRFIWDFYTRMRRCFLSFVYLGPFSFLNVFWFHDRSTFESWCLLLARMTMTRWGKIHQSDAGETTGTIKIEVLLLSTAALLLACFLLWVPFYSEEQYHDQEDEYIMSTTPSTRGFGSYHYFTVECSDDRFPCWQLPDHHLACDRRCQTSWEFDATLPRNHSYGII